MTGPRLPATQVFPVVLAYGDIRRRGLPVLAVAFLLAFFLAGRLSATALDGVAPVLVGVAVGGAVVVAMDRVRQRQFAAEWDGVALTVSAVGLHVREPHAATTLPWSGITELTAGDVAGPTARGIGDTGRAAARFARATMSRRTDALAGAGATTVEAGHRSLFAPDPRGRAVVVVGLFEDDWRSGQLGAWVRAARPDLLG
ncbi:hypothetical protein [Blastococcus sp. TF02A-26]|uniref:hypothetical protein n=1 Tax=Blastococcus sp. TF02A-26 TaxID=2250577 RepID=UPI000DE997A9|nr:hypothetical protein [Blastococcus sp. TF02A-26]RBY86104.1 hypothetical protein DQ240_09820 [Blastococcus sp. TF02A-26]